MGRIPTRLYARITAAAVAALLLAGCGQRSTPVTVDTIASEPRPDQESWSPELLISESGLPRLHIRAHYMARYETPDSTWMVLGAVDDADARVRVDLFDEAGDSSVVVFSDELTYYDRERRFVARGAVEAHARDDRHVYAEHLAWDERNQRIHTPGFARIESPGRTISGFGLTSNEDLSDVELSRVSGIIEPDDE